MDEGLYSEEVSRVLAQAHKELSDFLESDVPVLSIVPAELDGPLGYYKGTHIEINKKLYAKPGGTYRWIFPAEYFMHLAQDADTTNHHLLKDVITHELTHGLFYVRFFYHVEDMVESNIDFLRDKSATDQNWEFKSSPWNFVMAINEALSFYVQDKISGHRHLFEELASHLHNKLHIDGQTLRHFYTLFHNIGKKSNGREVVRNFETIVAANLLQKDVSRLQSEEELVRTSMSRQRRPLAINKTHEISYDTPTVAPTQIRLRYDKGIEKLVENCTNELSMSGLQGLHKRDYSLLQQDKNLNTHNIYKKAEVLDSSMYLKIEPIGHSKI